MNGAAGFEAGHFTSTLARERFTASPHKGIVMWHQAFMFAPHIAIASGIVLGLAIGITCYNRFRPAGSGFSMNNFISSSKQSTSSGFQKLWSSIVGQRPSQRSVIVHDPDLSKPHDLDDPFFDRKVQERIGAAIADAVQKK